MCKFTRLNYSFSFRMSSQSSHSNSYKMFLIASIFLLQLSSLNSAPVDQIKSDIDPNHHEADSINDLVSNSKLVTEFPFTR